MSQNISHAVMAQRHEADDNLDFFPTPPWATRALIEHVLVGNGWRLDVFRDMVAEDPACGAGHMVRPLMEYFSIVRAADVHDYGVGAAVADFLFPGRSATKRSDFIVTNPPFRLAAEFIAQALDFADEGVAMLVRTSFLEGAGRYAGLFKPHPPLIVAPFVERVPMVKGRLDRKASSATSYTWIVWPGRKHIRIAPSTRCVWIPPCRKRLERDEDYI